MDRLVGDDKFMEILWKCGPNDVVTVSEYDGEYAFRPLDFEAFLDDLEQCVDIQDAHFELYNYLKEHEDVYVGFSN